MNSRFMRIISIFGIILLLTLQYFWVKNAYEMVERDLMEKSKDCLREAIDEELHNKLDESHTRFQIQRDEDIIKESIIPCGQFDNQSDINIYLQDFVKYIDLPCQESKIDSIFERRIEKITGFSPKHTIRIISDSIRNIRSKVLLTNIKGKSIDQNSINQIDTTKKYDEVIGNSIYLKLNSKQSVELVLTSPTLSVITKARYIFFVSIFLVILLGVILVFQYKSMIKDKEFGVFLKDFSRVLAHELRTPINDIYLLISTVLSKDFTDAGKIEKYQKESLNQCSKMLLSIDNILLISKSELSEIHVLRTYTDVRAFIEKIIDKYRNQYFLGKVLSIETHYISEDCNAFIDRDLMENAVINLIENAIKYSYKEVTISITCSIQNNHLILKFKDDGVGISNENIKTIFRIFKRDSKMDFKQIKGFGIGLFYVQKVIKAHKGNIEVASDEGHGSEFSIEIPSNSL